MAKLKMLNCANAVYVKGANEKVFQSDVYDIEEYDAFKIRIKHKTSGKIAHTSFFNAVYWAYDGAVNEPIMPSEEEDALLRAADNMPPGRLQWVPESSTATVGAAGGNRTVTNAQNPPEPLQMTPEVNTGPAPTGKRIKRGTRSSEA